MSLPSTHRNAKTGIVATPDLHICVHSGQVRTLLAATGAADFAGAAWLALAGAAWTALTGAAWTASTGAAWTALAAAGWTALAASVSPGLAGVVLTAGFFVGMTPAASRAFATSEPCLFVAAIACSSEQTSSSRQHSCLHGQVCQ